ncbi:MAG TPA: hypothetical protein DDZ51_27155 [Planctomycetaceae bacterium]|nr:hypothetical protein [Planctomycetaceae bacterium]
MSMDDSIDFSISLLRLVAKELQSLTPEQRQAIAEGTAKLKLTVETASTKKEVAAIASVKTDELRLRLEECKSRDEARSILQELKLSKKELQRISRELELPVPRDDDSERLMDRLIESIIGFRLRSIAIQGKADDTPQVKESNKNESI